MQKEVKKLPHSELEFTVSVPWQDWNKYVDGAVEEISKEFKIDGFRPGKAPRDMIEEKVGKMAILENAAEKAIRKTYGLILEQDKVEAIGNPKVEITKIAEGNDLEYKVITAVMPEIILSDWKSGIAKLNNSSDEKQADVKEEDVDREIKKLAESRAKLVTVRRKAKNGDSVVVDFSVKQDGVVIENGTGRNHPLVLGSNVFIPGFEDNLLDMQEGEEKEFELSFPESYHEKTLAGKPAGFKVKVNVVQEREIPEINDDFVKTLGKFNTLKELKDSIRDGMTKEREMKHKEEKRKKFLEIIIDSTKADLPAVLVEHELHTMIHEFENQIQMMGMNLDGYLEKMDKKKNDLESEWRPQSEKRVIASLAMEKIAKDLEIKISQDKIEEEMNKTLKYFKNAGTAEKDIDMNRVYAHAKTILENEAVFESLEKIA